MSDDLDSVKDRARRKLDRDMSPEFIEALNDPRTVEIVLNPDGLLWQERLGEEMINIGKISRAKAQSIIETVAGFHGKEITRRKPLLEGEFPLDGSRFAGQLPPVVTAPTFAIRKKAVKVFTLDQYVESGIMTSHQRQVIADAVDQHRNILVAGGTGSGKTTLINAVINQMVQNKPSERLSIIEDTGELQCSAKNYVQYHTTIDVTMTQLLRITLRMRPDRILVGEVRGSEALDLLDAWNTGHPGGAGTVHANSAYEALIRMVSLVSRNSEAPAQIEPLVAQAVHVVVFITRTPTGRSIEEIVEVCGFSDGRFITKTL